jgi:hypothetical protein
MFSIGPIIIHTKGTALFEMYPFGLVLHVDGELHFAMEAAAQLSYKRILIDKLSPGGMVNVPHEHVCLGDG